jgi:hypothetical protein
MKVRIALPFVVLAAWIGIQSRATAGQINPGSPMVPDAYGSISLTNGLALTGSSSTSQDLNFPPSPPNFTYSGSEFHSIGTSSATGTINVQPSPSISASASSTGSGVGSVSVNLLYMFELYDSFDPTNKSPVPTIFTASGGVSLPQVDNYPQAIVALGIYNPLNPIAEGNFQDGLFYDYACAGTGGCGQFAQGLQPQLYFSDSKDLTLTANTVYEIYMNVSIASSGNWMSTGFVDPTVEIDPTFADVSQYELLFSPDVGNAPLPSTWIMMLSGLLGLGLFGYRGAKKSSSAVLVT